jgi:hypothetical protein
MERRQDKRVSSLDVEFPQPTAEATCGTTSEEYTSRVYQGRSMGADWTIAPEKSPFAADEESTAMTLCPPADWPKMVTWLGSPPKARGEPAEGAKAVVDGHDDDVVAAGKVASVVVDFGRRARDKGAAVEVHGHGAAVRWSIGALWQDRGVDVQVQAVLRDVSFEPCLNAGTSELGCIDLLRTRVRAWRSEPQLVHWRVCEGHTYEAE